MVLSAQNFFVLLNSDRILRETPEQFEDFVKIAFDMYKNTIEEQFWLQDMGVSFDYSDKLDFQSRRDLIRALSDWRQEHPRPTLL